MCSIEEAAAATFDEYDKDGDGLLPVKDFRELIDHTYEKLNRTVGEQDLKGAQRHMNAPDERMINKDEYIFMVKEAIKDQGAINNQSDV